VKATGSGPELSSAASRAAAFRSISPPEMAASPVVTAWIAGAEIAATAHGPGDARYASVRTNLLVSSVGIVTTLVLVTVISVVKL
jgi:lysylphosphatidylglycerol synthetase-like protein (DUF2156 family)